jgi:hypothetical protein
MANANFCISESKCSLCGKLLSSNNNNDIIMESISGSEYFFDKNQCLLIFRRLNDFYGNNFKNIVEIQ